MVPESGKRCLITDFRNKAEADAWIVQTERMLRERDPRHRTFPRLRASTNDAPANTARDPIPYAKLMMDMTGQVPDTVDDDAGA
jgi:hypothetical protein